MRLITLSQRRVHTQNGKYTLLRSSVACPLARSPVSLRSQTHLFGCCFWGFWTFCAAAVVMRGFFILHTGRGASCSNLPPSSSFVAPSPPLPLVKTRGGTLRLNSAQPLQGASAVRGPLRFFFFLLIPGQALRNVHLRQSQCSPQTARDRPGPMKGDAWGWVTSCVCGETPPRPWREG